MGDVIGQDQAVEILLYASNDVRRRRDSSGAHNAVEKSAVDSGELRGITNGYDAPLDSDLAFETVATDFGISAQ